MKWLTGCALIYFCFYVAACSDVTKRESTVLGELRQTDSVDIIYYDVAGNDANFKFTSLSDASLIQTLVKDLSSKPVPEADCLKDGKIYCYRDGDVFNTIYFSFSNEQCVQLSYIRNAELHIFKMSAELKKTLQDHSKRARMLVIKDSVVTNR
jgi:hypothetical protein